MKYRNMLILGHPVAGRWLCCWLRRQGDMYSSRWWQLTTATGAFTPAATLWVIAHRLWIYMCVCVCKIWWVWACLWACMRLSVCACVHMCVSLCIYMHLYLGACVHVCMNLYFYALVHECVPACLSVSLCMCVFVCCGISSAHSTPFSFQEWNKPTVSTVKVKKYSC